MAENIETNIDPIVLYIVVRKELKMSAGKVAEQVGHAVQKLLMRYFKDQVLSKSKELQSKLHLISEKELERVNTLTVWADGNCDKIALGATDVEFASIMEETGKNSFVVKNNDKTEVEPGTATVLCGWPQKKSEACNIIKGLPLYR